MAQKNQFSFRSLSVKPYKCIYLTLFLFFLFFTVCLTADDNVLYSLNCKYQQDSLQVQFPYQHFINQRDRQALESGEDIAIVCRLEFWQSRQVWFDKLAYSVTNYLNINYDRWQQKYSIFYQDRYGWNVSRTFVDLDTLLDFATEKIFFSFQLKQTELKKESYLAYDIDIKYLTLEKLTEIREWLKGSKKKVSKGNKDGNYSFPNQLFGFLLRSTGFKNRSYVKSSEHFIPRELVEQIYF